MYKRKRGVRWDQVVDSLLRGTKTKARRSCSSVPRAKQRDLLLDIYNKP